MANRLEFLYPRSSYRGSFTPSRLLFDANLQEFAQSVGYICALEGNGKLSPEESIAAIEGLWERLRRSRDQLGIGHPAGDRD